jgi:flagellar hook-length control protein FliK
MTVDITPDELGPVRVHVELREGNVELRLAGHTEAARDALRAALPELRRALEAAGVGTGSFQISPDSTPFQDRSQNPNTPQHPQFGTGTDGRNPSGNPQNGHARPAWAGTDGRVPHQLEQPAPAVAGPAGSLDLAL